MDIVGHHHCSMIHEVAQVADAGQVVVARRMMSPTYQHAAAFLPSVAVVLSLESAEKSQYCACVDQFVHKL